MCLEIAKHGALSLLMHPQHPTPWTVLRLQGQQVGMGAFPNGFPPRNLTLTEAAEYYSGIKVQTTVVEPVCIRPSRGQKLPSLSQKYFLTSCVHVRPLLPSPLLSFGSWKVSACLDCGSRMAVLVFI